MQEIRVLCFYRQSVCLRIYDTKYDVAYPFYWGLSTVLDLPSLLPQSPDCGGMTKHNLGYLRDKAVPGTYRLFLSL